MGKKIRITVGTISLLAELNETKTAEAIWQVLPLKGSANLWGEEIYFSIPLQMELEDGRETVEAGDIGYWPPGQALCLFFGPTPVSAPGEIRPYSPVTVVGKMLDDPSRLKEVKPSASVTIERAGP